MANRVLSRFVGVLAASIIYWVAYFMMFGFVFSIGDMAEPPRGFTALVFHAFGALLSILGFPLMYLGEWPAGVELSRRIFGGDDSRVLLCLLTLNALLWGALIYVLLDKMRRRNATAA